MYGPGQALPPPRPATSGAVIGLRVLFTVLPIVSLGLLAWIPMLWLGFQRKRSFDWLMFAVVAGMAVVAFSCFGFSDDDNDWQANFGGTLLLICMFGTAAYFLIADIRGARTRPGNWPATSGYPQANPYVTGPISGGPGATAPRPPQGYPAAQRYATPPPAPIPGRTPPPAPSTPPANPPANTPVPPSNPPTGPRINQVRAELDELSDYLRKEEGR